MIQEIAPDLYRVEIPLPDIQLKYVNSYIIKGQPRNLIIDTGWYDKGCLKAMQKCLKKLAVDLDETDFFITHHHADHIGLVFLLANVKSTVYIPELEAQLVSNIGSGRLLAEISDFFRASGFPEDDPTQIVPPDVVQWYRAKTPLPIRFVEDGKTLDVGEYHLTCTATPGHSPGHMCLYESDKKLLIAGDHLLGDITPSIQGGPGGRNPLKQYLSSLQKTRLLHIDTVLPGHRSVFIHHEARIREIEDHHQQRSREVISILQRGSKNAYEVASQMSWNIGCDSWGSFPVLQSFFATGEAFAHLIYLEDRGDICREMKGHLALYSLIK